MIDVLFWLQDSARVDDRMFTFDHVFPNSSCQDDVYSQAVRPLVDSAFEGYNVTIIAYGQTGSGKTYTMGSMSLSEDEPKEDQGRCGTALAHRRVVGVSLGGDRLHDCCVRLFAPLPPRPRYCC